MRSSSIKRFREETRFFHVPGRSRKRAQAKAEWQEDFRLQPADFRGSAASGVALWWAGNNEESVLVVGWMSG
jgi:hypothetical protein